MLIPIKNIPMRQFMLFTSLGFAITTITRQIIKFISYSNSISNIKESKILTLEQINNLHQNTTKIIKLTCQNSTACYLRNQIGTNNNISGIYPLLSIINQQVNFMNQHQNMYQIVVDEGKILNPGIIVNNNVLNYQFKYSSIYDNQDTTPGIFGKIFIETARVIAGLFEIIIQSLQPSIAQSNIKIKGPTVGWIETTLKFLTSSPLLAQCKIQDGKIRPLLIGLTRQDLIKYYQVKQYRSVFWLALGGVCCYYLFRKSFKQLTQHINNFISQRQIKILQSNQLSVKVEDQLSGIICYNKCRNIIFKKCRHLAVCSQCNDTYADFLNKCPLCREDIEQGQFVNVYDCDE